MKNKKITALLLVLLCYAFVTGSNFVNTINTADSGEYKPESTVSVSPVQTTEISTAPINFNNELSSLFDDIHNSVTSISSDSSYCNPDSLTTKNTDIRVGNVLPEKLKGCTASVLRQFIFITFKVEILGGDQSQPDPSRRLWDQKQLFDVYCALYSLPKFFYNRTVRIARTGIAFGNRNILGFMQWNRPGSLVLCNSATKNNMLKEVLIHEMAHCFADQRRAIRKQWFDAFWIDAEKPTRHVITQPPTSYGCTNADEDIAESVRCYWVSGEWLKNKHPDRYEFIRKYIMDGKEYRK